MTRMLVHGEYYSWDALIDLFLANLENVEKIMALDLIETAQT